MVWPLGIGMFLGAQQGGGARSWIPSDFGEYWALDEVSGNRVGAKARVLADHNSVGSASLLTGRAASFNASTKTYLQCAHDTLFNPNKSFSWSFIFRPTTVNTYNMLVTKGSGAAFTSGFWIDVETAKFRLVFARPGPTFTVCMLNGLTVVANVTYHVVVSYDDSTKQMKIRVNDVDAWTVTFDAGSTPVANTADVIIGRYGPNDSRYITGLLDNLLYVPRVLTAAEITAAYNASEYAVVADGNSLTALDGWVNQLIPELSSRTRIYNYAVGGQTTAQMNSDAATQIDARHRGARTCVIGWEGTNDIYFGATAETAYNNLVTYYTARKNNGAKVIAMSLTPRSNPGTPAGFEAERQSVNTLLRANWQNYADAFVDIGGDAILGPAGAETNTTYYTDTVHMTAAGYAIVKNAIKSALANLGIS